MTSTTDCPHRTIYRCHRCRDYWCYCDGWRWGGGVYDVITSPSGDACECDPTNRFCTVCGVNVHGGMGGRLVIPRTSREFLATRLAPSARRRDPDRRPYRSAASRHDRRRWIRRLDALMLVVADMYEDGRQLDAHRTLCELLHPLLAARILRDFNQRHYPPPPDPAEDLFLQRQLEQIRPQLHGVSPSATIMVRVSPDSPTLQPGDAVSVSSDGAVRRALTSLHEAPESYGYGYSAVVGRVTSVEQVTHDQREVYVRLDARWSESPLDRLHGPMRQFQAAADAAHVASGALSSDEIAQSNFAYFAYEAFQYPAITDHAPDQVDVSAYAMTFLPATSTIDSVRAAICAEPGVVRAFARWEGESLAVVVECETLSDALSRRIGDVLDAQLPAALDWTLRCELGSA